MNTFTVVRKTKAEKTKINLFYVIVAAVVQGNLPNKLFPATEIFSRTHILLIDTFVCFRNRIPLSKQKKNNYLRSFIPNISVGSFLDLN